MYKYKLLNSKLLHNVCLCGVFFTTNTVSQKICVINPNFISVQSSGCVSAVLMIQNCYKAYQLHLHSLVHYGIYISDKTEMPPEVPLVTLELLSSSRYDLFFIISASVFTAFQSSVRTLANMSSTSFLSSVILMMIEMAIKIKTPESTVRN